MFEDNNFYDNYNDTTNIKHYVPSNLPTYSSSETANFELFN
ncbi:11889_t:CDS:1, partial [Funneliformis caledonium]